MPVESLPLANAASAPDAAFCPVCGSSNACAQAGPSPAACAGSLDCWCRQAVIPPAALARIPADARGRACLCAACARQG